MAILILSLDVNAISVVSDYLANDTMVLMTGTSNMYSIRLQNPTNNEIGIRLDYDKTFMKVIDYQEVYILQPQTTGYKILFNVTAPEKTGLYTIGYTVGEVEAGGSGGVSIRLKINRNFNLKVIEDPNKFHINYFLLLYVVILFIVAFVLLRMAIRRTFRK